ncbi:MAG: sulfite exporter TauE/SafE family protein [Porticoccaceae bacterium]|nr:sulfite exporter TauE/SafE family protein [Porticoccaceae bacterium]MDG1310996.1 sulfite exporter TauE/SafE family protein [Porticoccaceae bacterium]
MAALFFLAYDYWLLIAILAMAVLYSSVGHGGASGYLAAMALWGLAPETMRPAALAMNIVVTCWLLYRFKPYQIMPYKLFWPLVLASTPLAFIGGMISIDALAYRVLVGGLLLLAAVRMLVVTKLAGVIQAPELKITLLLGAALGFAAGLTGIGGGVFLSPLLLIFGWCSMRQSTAVAAGFILLNSLGGLAGYLVSDQSWPMGTGWLLIAAFIGCLVGAELASHRASSLTLQKLLALVLAIASVKMVFTALV